MIKLDHDPSTELTLVVHDGDAVTFLKPSEVVDLANQLYKHADWLLACGMVSEGAKIVPLEKLVDDLEEEIAGVRAEYEANGVFGLALFIVAWAREDAQRENDEQA